MEPFTDIGWAGLIYLPSELAIECKLAILPITCTAPATTYLSKT
jgi:hypothetical protein